MNKVSQSANNTAPARLPAINIPPGVDPVLRNTLEAIKERLEVRDGARGNPYERGLTVRDLVDAGLDVTLVGQRVTHRVASHTSPTGGLPGRGEHTLPANIEALINSSLAAEAARLGAHIQRVEHRLQTETESMASVTQQITAALGQARAGVRETSYANATANRATAGKVTQLVAALDGTGAATLDQSMVVIADRIQGLRSQYMLKLGAGNAVTGISLLASEDPSGATESAFIIQADRFQVKTAGGTKTPIGVDGDEIYLTGTVRINAGGPMLQDSMGVPGDSVDIVYRRSATQPATPAPSAITPSGWYSSVADVPAGADLIWSSVGTKPGTGSSYAWDMPLLIQGSGTNGDDGFSIAELTIFRRAASAPATPTGGSYDFGAKVLTPPSGWSASVPAGTDPVYTSRATASVQGATGTAPPGTWSTPTVSFQNGANGTNGTDGANGTNGDSVDIVYQRAATQPATPGGSAGTPSGWYSSVSAVPAGSDPIWSAVGTKPGIGTSYTWQIPLLIQGTAGASGLSIAELTIFRRAASAPATPTGGSYDFGAKVLTPPSGWSASVPAGTDPVYTSRATASVAGVTGSGAAGAWSSPTITFRDGANGTNGTNGTNGADGSPGAPGARGSITLYQTGAWSDAAATSAILSVTGTANAIGDTVTFTSGDVSTTRYWSGSSWVNPGVIINGNLLVGGIISSSAMNTSQYVRAQGFVSNGSQQAAIWGENATHNGFAVVGISSTAAAAGAGFFSSTNGTAVYATGGSGTGVYGSGIARGVYGQAMGAGNTGVVGHNPSGYGLECQGKLRFGAYDILQPDGSASKFLCATGAWIAPPGASSIDWNSVTGKPTAFPPSTHDHYLSSILPDYNIQPNFQFSQDNGVTWNSIRLRRVP